MHALSLFQSFPPGIEPSVPRAAFAHCASVGKLEVVHIEPSLLFPVKGFGGFSLVWAGVMLAWPG